ncbi:MAG: hypothetical protein CTY34_05345 [Methylobacter sp.]|nr:MAG: hypothetical protein CTY34_05345 [Methylobacter sp.]PPD36802.1 MAG: hypothetical protein CTY18_03180 [Methylomonas sp.]
MTSSNRKIAKITPVADNKTLSKAQKQFNALTKKIDAAKKSLREWQETISDYYHKVGGEYEELTQLYNSERIKLVQLFDGAYENKLFKKTDKAKIQYLITEITEELMVEQGMTELKDLYNKYSEIDFDTLQQQDNAIAGDFIKAMVEQTYGVEIEGELDLSSPEQMMNLLHEKLQDQKAREEEQQRQAEERRSKRKKSAKQLAQEAKKQQEEQSISQSIREVYRKLTSALHPDREQDPVERERKTGIMQRVNAAYGKKDLLSLLELQLEAEQIDQTHMNNIAEDRLKYINKILKEQLDELQLEIDQLVFPIKLQLNMPPYLLLSPKRLLQELELDIEEIRRAVSQIREELAAYQDLTILKASLKGYKIPKRPRGEDFDDLFFDESTPPFRF